ncbi:hypothetical protein BJX61DRAFT_109194 [Aspergillus egyptiacus]|nr:hypothetical protein BJX61DRAFT_109194 [Aspergillus egyptiacus]
MPETPAKSSAALGIQLEHVPGRSFAPGDRIVGRVYRTTPTVAPEARMVVTLHGRTKSKITIKRGVEAERRYRASFNTLSAPVEYQVPLANAPLHIPRGSDGLSWPFALTIPSVVNDVRDSHQRREYAAPGGADGAPFPPPGTFDFYYLDFLLKGEKVVAFIEYYIQAELILSHQHKGRTKTETYTATAPFHLHNRTPGPPVADFRMGPYTQQTSITAYRLTPGVEETSLGQKTRQLFRPSKVPRLAFNVTVLLPHVLQLDNPTQIPVTVLFDPLHLLTSEALYDVPQQITIKSFSLHITEKTTVQAEDRTISSSGSKAILVGSGDLARRGQDSEVSTTLTPTAKPTGGPAAVVNLGQMLDLRMGARELRPSFATYNISHVHKLHWELVGVVAGQKFKLRSKHLVTVLPRSSQTDCIQGGELPPYVK